MPCHANPTRSARIQAPSRTLKKSLRDGISEQDIRSRKILRPDNRRGVDEARQIKLAADPHNTISKRNSSLWSPIPSVVEEQFEWRSLTGWEKHTCVSDLMVLQPKFDARCPSIRQDIY